MNCALITGASKGIGKAIALQLAKDLGLHILINYANDDLAAQETLASLQKEGFSAELLKFPVQDKQAVVASLEAWQEANPEAIITVLVNNAGIKRDGWLMWMSEENWDEVLDVSLKGLYNVTQQVVKGMMKNKWGRIINISSTSGLKGIAGQMNYSAAKAGMIGATKALAQELGKMKITVNAVAPGFIDTDMIKDMEVDKYLSVVPAGRVGKAEEVAYLVSFLASDRAAYINGEVININGGLYS